MMNVKHLVLLLIGLISFSCNTTIPREYFNRPEFSPTIANGDGTGFKNGELVETTNMICIEPNNYIKLENYWIDKETRLYFCLAFGECK